MTNVTTKSAVAGDSPASAPDPDRTRQNILEIATEEFAARGLSGARVDAIAARTLSSKRMIYYYFGSKNGLYTAVLDKVYGDIRAAEAQVDFMCMPPTAALRTLVEITFDYDEKHARFISLVSIENIHRAATISKSPSIRKINEAAIRTLEDILNRGMESGEFRKDVVALDVHMLISAFCFFRISNRHSLEAVFDCDLLDPVLRERQKRMIVKAVLSYVQGK